jgi:hypothetical protein
METAYIFMLNFPSEDKTVGRAPGLERVLVAIPILWYFWTEHILKEYLLVNRTRCFVNYFIYYFQLFCVVIYQHVTKYRQMRPLNEPQSFDIRVNPLNHRYISTDMYSSEGGTHFKTFSSVSMNVKVKNN